MRGSVRRGASVSVAQGNWFGCVLMNPVLQARTDVRLAPGATELLRRRDISRRARNGLMNCSERRAQIGASITSSAITYRSGSVRRPRYLVTIRVMKCQAQNQARPASIPPPMRMTVFPVASGGLRQYQLAVYRIAKPIELSTNKDCRDILDRSHLCSGRGGLTQVQGFGAYCDATITALGLRSLSGPIEQQCGRVAHGTVLGAGGDPEAGLEPRVARGQLFQ
jgi:hypothetical protein